MTRITDKDIAMVVLQFHISKEIVSIKSRIFLKNHLELEIVNKIFLKVLLENNESVPVITSPDKKNLNK